MYHVTPNVHDNTRAFVACFLAFVIIMTPLAAVAASTRPRVVPVNRSTEQRKPSKDAQSSPFEPMLGPLVPTITATKTDTYANSPGDASPGHEITYDINVANGGTDASNVQFSDTIDPNTTLVPGSVKMSPIARPDSYTAEQDTPLSVAVGSGVLGNDAGIPAPTAVAIAGGATAQGGTVTLNVDGSFTYTPPSGFTGTDTFTYTATNGFSPNDTATVTINIDAAPTVSSTTPTDGATTVATNTNIVINFSESVNATTSSFTVECPGGSPQTFTIGASPATSFTLDPTSDLPVGTICTVTVLAAQITDADSNDPPDNMAANFVFSFTTDPPPTVTTTTPTNGATGVASNADISVTFSENVNTAAGAFTISCGTSGAHTFVQAGGPATFTLNPATDFTQGETCTVTVVAANVTDQDTGDPPNNMAANFVFSFTVDLAPTVTAATPTNGATNIAGNTDVTVTFSEAVNAAANAFTISCATSGAHTFALSGGPTTFTLNPNTDFSGGEVCTVTVLAANVTDQDGNDPPDNMLANFVFSFTIDQAPSVTSTTPTNGATQIANNTNISLTFSEDVSFTASSFTISCATSGAHTAVVSGGPQTWTLNPDIDFANGELCTITILAAQVTDTDTNDPPNNMAANFVFSFTVDNPPTVTTTTPTNGATGVAANTNITVNFSESVNATTSSFQIECPSPGNTQAFTLSASPSNTFTLDPTSNLPVGVICTVTVFAAQITDADAGDPPDNMAANHVFSFSVPPDAVNDARSATGNIRIQTAGRSNFSLLTNDIGPGITVTAFDATSLRGGNVSVAANGSFSYNPPPGYEGSDTFNYTISNIAGSDTATVTITISGMIWFIDDSASACTTVSAAGGCGRLTNPLSTLASFEAVNGNADTPASNIYNPAANDHIFIYSGSYTAPLTLEAGQRVIGQGATSSLQTLSGVTPATDSDSLPSTTGLAADRPSITSAGNGFNLVSNNRLYGFAFSNTAGTAINSNGNVGTLILDFIAITNSASNGAGIVLDDGGTSVTATGTNVINTRSGVGLSLTNSTTIGAGGLTFQSISAGNNDANPDPANGIVLINTGATAGLTVNGDGANTTVGGNSTGGTISNIVGADGATSGNGVYLSNAHNVTLRRMTINGTNQNHGIRGIDSSNFTLEFSRVSGTNGTSAALDEGSVNFDNLTGTAAITSCVIEGGFEDNLNIINTSGTLNRLTISGTTLGFNGSGTGNNNIQIESLNAGTTLNFTLKSSLIKGARADFLSALASSGSTMDAVIGGPLVADGNTFDNLAPNNHPTAAAGGNRVVSTSVGTQTVDIRNNTLKGSKGEAIRVRSTISSPLRGNVNARVRNNTIGVAATANSGSSESFGVFIFIDGGASMTAAVTSNQIFQYNNSGIHMTIGDQMGGAPVNNVTITGNTINTPGNANPAANFNAIHLDHGTIDVPADSFTSCIDIGGAGVGNNVAGGGKGPVSPNNNDIRVRQRQATTVRLPGYGGANNNNAAVVTYLTGRNTLTTAAAANTVPTGGGFIGGAACTAPSFAMANPLKNKQSIYFASNESAPKPIHDSLFANFTIGTDLSSLFENLKGLDEYTPARPTGRVSTTQTDQTTPARREKSLDRLNYVASEVRGQISEIRPADARTGKAGAKSQQSAVRSHHAKSSKATPTSATAKPAPMIVSGETVNLNIGSLSGGKTVHIQFKVTINNGFTGNSVSNQGTVTADGSISVLTDDPSVGGATDPTVTPITVPSEISINNAVKPEPATATADMTFTVSLSQPANGNVNVDFTTQDEPAGPGKAVAGTCGSGGDYTTTTGTVNFTAGEQVKTINVPICSDAVSEPDETFRIVLSNPTGGNIADGAATGTITANTPGTLIISELRTSGPGGAGDDFVELYNNSDSPITVNASDASAGYGIYKMGSDCNATPVLLGTIPNSTVIPARAHYLFVGSAYSLGNYGGTGAAAGNLTLSADIEDDRNVGIFSTSNVAAISSVNRLDAVGFGLNTGGVCNLLREGATLGPVLGSTLQYSFFRKECDFVLGSGCTVPGTPKDTNDNSADFLFADTAATLVAGAGQHLGAPGPQNLASPVNQNPTISVLLLDPSVPSTSAPNRVVDLTSDPANNSTLGTITIRRRVVNNTGGSVNRLRFRVVELTTAPPPVGIADLRGRTSMTQIGVGPVNDAATCAATGTPATAPCTVTVQGLTLEQPPTQTMGGGYNSTVSAGTITLATPLLSGASINVQFLLGVQQTGTSRFAIIIESLPLGGSSVIFIEGGNATPVVTTTGGNLAYTENAGAVVIDSGLTVTDADNTDLTGATVAITSGFDSSQDTLAFTDQLGITGNYDSGTGVLTLTGITTVANYQTALRTVTYQNSSDAPTSSRTITFNTTDSFTVGSATRGIAITAVNDGPVNTIPGPQSTTEDTSKVFSSGNGNQISVADADAGSNPIKITLTATNGTVTLSGTAGLTFTPPADGTNDAAMVFTGTLSAVNTALNGMSFNPTTEFNGAASLQIISDDQGNTGTGGSLTDTDSVNIAVTATNDNPVLTATVGNLSYTEGDPATAIDPGLTVTDVDSANLTGATVAITANFASTEDVLAFTNQLGIIGHYNSGTGVLTLTGATTVANYQTALRSVTYQNNSENPSTSVRTVTFTADDGTATGSATRGIAVTSVNDAPVNAVPGAQEILVDALLTFSGGSQVSVADVDAGSNTIQVALTATNGTITLASTSGLSFSFSDANGTAAGDGTADATMTFRGTIANINNALNGMTFTPSAGFSGPASVQVATNDLGNTGSGGPQADTDTINISVVATLALTVNTTGDQADANVGDRICDVDLGTGGNQCTLRAAIQETNNAGSADTIGFNLPASSTIEVTGALPAIAGDLAINGPTNGLTIDGNSTGRVFNVTSGTVTINTLAVTGGSVTGGHGAGLLVTGGDVTVKDMLFTANTVVNGNGGAIAVTGGLLTILNSTVSGNTATNAGGVYNGGGGLTMINDTVTNNTANGDTGSGPTATGHGGGLHIGANPAFVRNTIIAGNTATTNTNVSGTLGLGGNNLLTGNPLLAPLANNGGPTLTHALEAGSPALDAGDNNQATTAGLVNDQRGFDRITDGNGDAVDTVDIGAFEAQVFLEDIADRTIDEDGSDSFSFNVGGAAAITNVTATSSNTALVPNLPAALAISGSGGTRTLTITPTLNAFGTTTITVTVESASGSMTDTFLFTVNAVNDPPTFTGGPDVVASEDAGPQSIPNWATGISPGPANESTQTLNFVVSNNNNSLFSVQPAIATNGTLTFTPAANASGVATVSVQLQDNGGGTDLFPIPAYQFTITVTALNDAPTANGQSVNTNEDTPLPITLTGSDAETPSGSLIFTITDQPDHGVLSGTGANRTYTPDANYNGPDSFKFTVTDTGDGLSPALTSAEATVSITVNAVNDAPTANGQNVNTNEDTSLPIILTGTDVETTSGNLIFNVTVQPTNGVLSGTGANRTYTPNANFNGADSFKFTVTDTGDGSSPALTSAEATVNITVNAVNDGPLNTVPGAQSVTENSTLTFSAGNGNQISIADVDAGAPGVQVTLTATNGTFTLAFAGGLIFTVGDGTADATMTFTGTVANINADLNGLVFTPTSGFSGAASLQITTNDLGNTGSGGALSDTDTVNITVNDGGALQFSSATYSVNEADGSATITVNRTGGTAGTTTVQFATSNGTATAGSDYTAATGTLSFGPGVTTQTFSVPITIDHDNEANETVNLTLSNVTGSGALGTPSTAVLTIVDDDPGGALQFSSATYTAGENIALITVVRVGGFAGTTTVDYTTSNGTATAGADYTTTSGTLTFEHGSTSQSFFVPILNDTADEPDETVNLTLSNVSGTGTLGTPSTAVLTIIDNDPPTFSLNASSYTVDEDDLRVTVTVNRGGDLSEAVTVDYASSDPSALNACSQVTGNASQRCDYATVVGTLRFAAFEISKVIHIPIVDDVYIEGAETFTITLSNASGGDLATPATATVTINDNDVGPAPNPIDNDAFWIRQMYIDILGREPEPGAVNAWLAILNNCTPATNCDRTAVALGFLKSVEFQGRGFFAYRFYAASLGRPALYSEFVPDHARFSGFLSPAELELNKQDYVTEFMNRAEFKAIYDPTIGNNTHYVDTLLQRAGLPNHPQRTAWINGLNAPTLTRADVLRQLVESNEVYFKFLNEGFVVMNYFGLLRRSADAQYLVWIQLLNQTGDERSIVTGFINSAEYRLRFGPN